VPGLFGRSVHLSRLSQKGLSKAAGDRLLRNRDTPSTHPNAGARTISGRAGNLARKKIFFDRVAKSCHAVGIKKGRLEYHHKGADGGVARMDDWPDFRNVNWPDLYPRLLLYAVGRLRRLLWSRARPQCQDFVQRAIEKALSKERSYDRRKTLFQNLCQIISSDISHEVLSYENKHTVPQDDTVINLIDYKQNPEETTRYGEISRDLLCYLGSRDTLAKKIADLMINSDITKSTELSVTLGLSVRQVENAKKRLRRLTEGYIQSSKEKQKASTL